MIRRTVVFFLLVLSQTICAQWVDFNPGISGDFYDIDINGTTKHICGTTGIFESTDYISWTPVVINSNPTDSLIFTQTIFYGIATYSSPLITYACGQDTINNNAVLFKKASGIWILDYSLPAPSKFRDVKSYGSSTTARIFVVGDNGKILLRVGTSGIWTDYSYPTTKDLYAIDPVSLSKVMISGENIVLLNGNPSNTVWDSISDRNIFDMSHIASNAIYAVQVDQVDQYLITPTTWNSNSAINSAISAQAIDIEDYDEGYVGSTNGIYKCTSLPSYPWEFQPSSVGYDIQEITTIPTASYAVGKNSSMIKTTNSGGVVFPYVNYNAPAGACVDSTIFFDNLSKPGSTTSWYINGVFQASTFDLNFAFTTLGVQSVKLVVNNGTYTDSITKTIEVVSLPDSGLAFDVSDTLLCKMGESIFSLHGTESDVHYSLHFLETGLNTPEFIGNGGDLDLNTGTLYDSVHVLIRARRYNSDCDLFFPDTTLIGVEKTNSDFFVSNINAALNAPVYLYNHSDQATIFTWNIYTPIPTTHTNYEFAHSFVDTGLFNIELIAESNTGCIDTTIKFSPYIYNSSEIQSFCWALTIGGIEYAGYDHDRLHDVEVNDNGDIFVIGSMNEATFESEHGLNGVTTKFGSYVAKYDEFGVLQWKVECDQTGTLTSTSYLTNYSEYGDAFNLELSENGNIYISGWYESGGKFYSNDGDTILPALGGKGFVLKLDSLGRYVWSAHSTQPITEMKVGKDENLFVGGQPYNFWGVSLTGTDANTLTLPNDPEGKFFLAKLDSIGHYKFATYTMDINTSAAYLNYLNDMAIDSNLNVSIITKINYVSIPNTFYSATSPDSLFNLPTNLGCVLYQYDSIGDFKWAASMYKLGTGGTSMYAQAIETDKDGNIYALIQSQLGYPTVIKDAAGSFDTAFFDNVMIVSFTSAGVFRWAEGIGSSNNALYGDICVRDSAVYIVVNPTSIDSVWMTSTIPGDSIICYAPIAPRYLMFQKWTTSGVPIWVSYHNGNIYTDEVMDLSYKSLKVDQDHNLIFGCYGNSQLGDNYHILAGDTITLKGQDGILCKYNQGMCSNNSSMPGTNDYCVGNQLEVPFNFQSIDTLANDSITYYIVVIDITSGLAVDTLGMLVSSNIVDTIVATSINVLPGNYNLVIKSENPDYATNPVPIFIGQLPVIQNVDTTICFGTSFSFVASVADTYNWTPVNNISNPAAQTILLYPDTSTIYIGLLTNFCGSVYDSLSITIISAEIFAGNDTTICSDDSLIILANGPPSISWSDGLVNGNYISPSADIMLIATGQNGICVDKDTLNILVNISPTPICFILDDTLISTQVYDFYQWYLDGVLIPGAINQSYTYSVNGTYYVEVWDNGCFGTSPSLQIDDVNISETEFENSIILEPNPTSDICNIYFDSQNGKVELKIYDIAGNQIIVKQVNSDAQTSVDVSSLANGLYYIIITQGNKTSTKKLVKM